MTLRTAILASRGDIKKAAVPSIQKKRIIDVILNHRYNKKTGQPQYLLIHEDKSVAWRIPSRVAKGLVDKYHERLHHCPSPFWNEEKKVLFSKAAELLLTNTERVPSLESREEQVSELELKLRKSKTPPTCYLKTYTGYLFGLTQLNGRRDPKNIFRIVEFL